MLPQDNMKQENSEEKEKELAYSSLFIGCEEYASGALFFLLTVITQKPFMYSWIARQLQAGTSLEGRQNLVGFQI